MLRKKGISSRKRASLLRKSTDFLQKEMSASSAINQFAIELSLYKGRIVTGDGYDNGQLAEVVRLFKLRNNLSPDRNAYVENKPVYQGAGGCGGAL